MQDPYISLLTRPKPSRAVISLVPMIDVMLILLVFFMVTSTYLNLDMIPAAQRSDDAADQTTAPASSPGAVVMVRLGGDGVATIRGTGLDDAAFEAFIKQRLEGDPALRVLILPSGAAHVQALVSVMDRATRAGAANVQVVRIEAVE